MSLDDVDIQVLLLDRLAAARNSRDAGPAEDTVEGAMAAAMNESGGR